MSDTPNDIDIEAETEQFRKFFASAPVTGKVYCWRTWLARARLAAGRERELCDMLADAQHAVCCYSCPEPREGEPDRHCETCVRIGEALTRKGPTDER